MMNNETFEAIKNRIFTDTNRKGHSWYDGMKYVDPQGNWYGWTDCGMWEYLFYAGTQYRRHALCDGCWSEVMECTEVADRPGAQPHTEKRCLCEYLTPGERECDLCPFGLTHTGRDCPQFESIEEALADLADIADRVSKARRGLEDKLINQLGRDAI